MDNLNDVINETLNDSFPSLGIDQNDTEEADEPTVLKTDSHDINLPTLNLNTTSTEVTSTESNLTESTPTEQTSTETAHNSVQNTEPVSTITTPSETPQSPLIARTALRTDNDADLPPTTSNQTVQNTPIITKKSNKRSSSNEDTIEILDDSTCIDLTNNDDGEIIIEKSVCVKPRQRWRNRLPRIQSNNLDATIVIDDDSPQATASETRNSPPLMTVTRPFPSMPVRLPVPFFGYAGRSQSRIQPPQPPTKRSRTTVPEKSESEKRKEFMNKMAASKEKAKNKPAETEPESSGDPAIQCPICLESLAELKKKQQTTEVYNLWSYPMQRMLGGYIALRWKCQIYGLSNMSNKTYQG